MNDDNKTLIKLLNPKFTFQFADKEYLIRKANMGQMVQFQARAAELMNDKDMPASSKDLEMLSYCVYLLLKEVDSTITEQFVKDNMPGSVDGLSILADLGFIDPQKLELVKRVQEKIIIQDSSPTSQTEPDGGQTKSAS